MPITPEDVVYTARLARLELSREEIERFGRDLARIGAYIAQLTEVADDNRPIEEVLPLVKSAEALRADEVRPSFPAEVALSQAPDAHERFFRVPKVIG